MKNKRYHNLSLRVITLISFIVFLVTTVFVVGYINITNWIKATEGHIKEMAEQLNDDTISHINDFIDMQQQINIHQQNFIEQDILDLKNEIARDKYFVSFLKQLPENIYSITFTTADGDFYGARRKDNDEIEIIRNNETTGGNTWYYSVNKDFSIGEKVYDAGNQNPLLANWYLKAVREKKPIFSSINKTKEVNDLFITFATPVYKDDNLIGVIGTHTTLSNINEYLLDITNQSSIALIIEDNTGELIANSLNIENFITKDNDFIRNKINNIDNESIIKGYQFFRKSNSEDFNIKTKDENYYFSVTKYNNDGLEWLIIAAVPSAMLMKDITNTIYSSILITIIGIIISSILYYFYTKTFMLKPIYSLIKTTEKIAQGDLNQRINIKRDDELGHAGKAINKMAETISKLVYDLEGLVEIRTQSLTEINNELKNNKDQLQLILDSAREAIYGIDLEGKCTFCNKSSLTLLGYQSPEELLGKNMHDLIHHSDKNGIKLSANECKIMQSLINGTGITINNEVFWRADGTYFDVEYSSYPQYKDNKIIGAVITFIDITERKKDEARIRYLSYYDDLTGLYNRNAFFEKLENIEKQNLLPITIIFGDLNGLKLTNDIFGHAAGDRLLMKTAEILKEVLREDDIIARFGGDEFVMALPKTNEIEAEKLIKKIKEVFAKEDTVAMMASISLGFETKTVANENIIHIIDSAEAWMYKDKMDKRKTTNFDTINKILNILHKKSRLEKPHSINVSLLCHDLGVAMGKNENEIRKFKDAGYYHDIGKIIISDDLLNYSGPLDNEEHKLMEQHTVVGYRILNLFDETLDIAEDVLYHHEKWNGTGYPKGLKGEEIPELARVIRIAETYDFLINRKGYTIEKALKELESKAGIVYDPSITKIFVRMILDKSKYKSID